MKEYSEIDALREYCAKEINKLRESEKKYYPDGNSFILGLIRGYEDIERGFGIGRYKRMITMHRKKVADNNGFATTGGGRSE